MKYLILISALVFTSLFVNSQKDQKKSKKEIRAEKNIERIAFVKEVVENKTFVFGASQVLPLSGGSKNLDYFYDVKLKNDTVISNLPYFGVAYYVEYGSRTGGFQFTQPINDYKFEKDKKGYHVHFEAKNKNDNVIFNFQISELGYTTLTITSTNRQSISYYGTLKESADLKN